MPDVDQAPPPAVPQPGEHPSDYCGPCKSGKHAKCYEPCLCRDRGHGAPVSAARTLPVTPAEQHLAAILRSFQAWNTHPDAGIDEEDEALQLMLGLGEWLQEEGMLNDDEPGFTPAGAALLARVEAAPGYEQGRRDAIADAADHLSACHDPTITPRNAARMIVDHEAARLAGATPLDAPPAKEPR